METYRTYTPVAYGTLLLLFATFIFAGVAHAQERGIEREVSPVNEQINIQTSALKVEERAPERRSDFDSSTDDSKDKKSEAINHDASRSNNTNSRIDPNEDESDAGDTEVQRERKKPGRVTYGNITLERAFNTDSPYQDEMQEVEATQKVFLFGVIPMQVHVVARINKDEDIEVTQRPWYAFLFWR